MPPEIIPAILPKSITDLRSNLSRIRGEVSVVQIDIADGHFVPNTTWPYQGDDGTFERVSREEEGMPFWEEFDYELDLMVRHPETALPQWVEAGASRIIVHLESTTEDMLHDLIREWGHAIEFGIGVNNGTPLSQLTPFLEKEIFVQCMGIARIGFQGEPFDERVLDRLKELRRTYPNLTLAVDGGVTLETAPMLLEAGANRLVAGSAIVKSDDPIHAIHDFKEILKNRG